jgi:hypothetical protein
MSLPAADTRRPHQQPHPGDDRRRAEPGELSVTRHARAMHGARTLGDPHRANSAEDDPNNTTNPHHALRSAPAAQARYHSVRISVPRRLSPGLKRRHLPLLI